MMMMMRGPLLLCLCSLSAFALLSSGLDDAEKNPTIRIWSPPTAKTGSSYHMQENQEAEESSMSLKRHLSAIGSSPPDCTSKCGSCTPCEPVAVAVPPEKPFEAESNPVVWRCKCGDKLYAP